MAWTSKVNGPIVLFSEVAVNSSSKTLAAADYPSPDSSLSNFLDEMEIVGMRIEYVSSGQAGNRIIGIQVLDADNADDIVQHIILNAAHEATRTEAYEVVTNTLLAPVDVTAANTIFVSSPRIFLSKNYKLKIFDSAAIDAAIDDMVVHVRAIAI